ncbi:MAG: hypothetical protein MUF51_05965, partial [Vicinamibacteria bacterium]|nr:hypothetical protein [Vicinamibacteria bacterium]
YRWVKPAHTSSPSAVTPSPNPTPSLETTPASTPTLATGEPARPDIPVSTPAPSPTIARIAGAQMEIAIEHPLKSGRMRVWVSEDLAVDQRLTSWSKKRSLTFKTRQGVSRSLDIAPGERTVRVRIDWDDTMQEETIRGRFESGRTRRLAVKLGGLLKKRISLYWEDAN